jgi:hypothetical protein
MKGSCTRTRRSWLLAQDGQANLWVRLTLGWHFRGCSSCRAFASAARAVCARMPEPDGGIPGAHVARALHLKAAAELAPARAQDQREENQLRVRQSLFGTLTGAAAALLFAFMTPTGIDIPSPGTSAASTIASEATSLDDKMDSLEDRLKCLQALIDDFNWNSLEGGDPCADT